ncbi:hypothetical protein PVAP13_5NG376781 [Panicum virgatum]|uniref:Uncharacterized protein n=1 Tax=Panicum virgatum TaxID=38727 RepID=A0A8T0RVT6_PANVG|nr:hypothetical protein PVAP13_5NG376781 [Panicum virgatum]
MPNLASSLISERSMDTTVALEASSAPPARPRSKYLCSRSISLIHSCQGCTSSTSLRSTSSMLILPTSSPATTATSTSVFGSLGSGPGSGRGPTSPSSGGARTGCSRGQHRGPRGAVDGVNFVKDKCKAGADCLTC